jgi:hypothetical protein
MIFSIQVFAGILLGEPKRSRITFDLMNRTFKPEHFVNMIASGGHCYYSVDRVQSDSNEEFPVLRLHSNSVPLSLTNSLY